MNSKAIRTGSIKANQFSESVIREMSRLAAKHQAINLAQGLPDFPCPDILKQKASEALFEDVNQYAITWGDRLLREAIAHKAKDFYGLSVNSETDITVTCGATEAMVATMLALVNPDEEVIVFEPYYENYGPDAILSGAKARYVSLHPPEWRFDEEELRAAFNNKTRAIIINSPHNPTGAVFEKEELEIIASLCKKWGVFAITDEIYEHILYDDQKHFPLATISGMEDLTITINSLSKTFSVTGWRVGWAIAQAPLTASIRKVHDFLTVGAPAPLQRGAVAAMNLGQEYYQDLKKEYTSKRTHLLDTLASCQIPYIKPEGAYYVLSDITKYGWENDIEFTKHLVENVGVAVVPGSSFFRPGSEIGRKYVRFCFSRRDETLDKARLALSKAKLKK
jgi:aminotransferase